MGRVGLIDFDEMVSVLGVGWFRAFLEKFHEADLVFGLDIEGICSPKS